MNINPLPGRRFGRMRISNEAYEGDLEGWTVIFTALKFLPYSVKYSYQYNQYEFYGYSPFFPDYAKPEGQEWPILDIENRQDVLDNGVDPIMGSYDSFNRVTHVEEDRTYHHGLSDVHVDNIQAYLERRVQNVDTIRGLNSDLGDFSPTPPIVDRNSLITSDELLEQWNTLEQRVDEDSNG